MIIDGLIPANPSYMRAGNSSGWNSAASNWSYAFFVIGAGTWYRAEFTNQPGLKKRIELDCKVSTLPGNLTAYLLTQNVTPPDVPAAALATAALENTLDLQTLVFDNVSITAESYYVCFHNNGAYNDLAIKAARADTSYTVYSQLNVITGPTGDRNTENAIPFSANISQTAGSYNPFRIINATLHWRAGTIGPYEQVEMVLSENDTLASVSIPGGTFSSGASEWYISATDNDGTSLETALYAFYGSNRFFQVTPLSPADSLVGNNEPITFAWRFPIYSIADRRQCDLQYSRDGEVWADLASAPVTETSGGSYTAPAGTVPAGLIFWRVRVIAVNGGVGSWSAAVSFEAVGAAIVSNVEATDVPFSAITWEVNGALAYSVDVDGDTFGPYRDKGIYSFLVTSPLADGDHIIKIRAQNKYGLWSDWASAEASVENIPGAEVMLTAEGTQNGMMLTISGGESTGDFWIYRDGALIGTTRRNYFTDRTALGAHEYYVLQVLPDGYYTKSNTVTLTGYVDCPAIALLSGGDFLALTLSEDANRTQTITKTGEVAYVQYSGAKFPEAEIGEAESLSATGDVSFTAAQEADARRFEAMLKKPVIYKTPGGEVVVGVLQGFTRRDPRFFKSYTFSVTQMEWRDFVNA